MRQSGIQAYEPDPARQQGGTPKKHHFLNTLCFTPEDVHGCDRGHVSTVPDADDDDEGGDGQVEDACGQPIGTVGDLEDESAE